jgi:protein SCO1/2
MLVARPFSSRFVAAVVLGVALLIGCGETEAPPEPAYPTRGVYVGPQYGGQAAVIAHEAIPGTMEAMRMTFRLDDPAVLDTLRPGDKLAFDLVDTERGYAARNLERLPDTTTLVLPAPDTSRAVPDTTSGLSPDATP